jgi:hypothetical protein
VLIGWKFIQSQDTVVDGKNGEVMISAERISFLPCWRVFPRVCSAFMESTMTIPSRCEMDIRARLETVRPNDIIPDGFSGVHDPVGVFRDDMGILVARTAGTVAK